MIYAMFQFMYILVLRSMWAGRAGGGGVLRDGAGRFLLAFSAFFGRCSSIQAEARALLVGISLCISRGYRRVHVEADSLILVQILKSAIRHPWSIDPEVRRLLQLSSHFASVSHCFREGNQVADCLSKVGCDAGCDRSYFQVADLPMMARGAFRLDSFGFPSLRIG